MFKRSRTALDVNGWRASLLLLSLLGQQKPISKVPTEAPGANEQGTATTWDMPTEEGEHGRKPNRRAGKRDQGTKRKEALTDLLVHLHSEITGGGPRRDDGSDLNRNSGSRVAEQAARPRPQGRNTAFLKSNWSPRRRERQRHI